MRYHISLDPTLLKPHHTWEYAVGAVQAGIQGFEISDLQSYLPREEFHRYLQLIKRLKKQLKVGLTIHAPILDVHLGSLNRKIREVSQKEVRASLDLAKSLGVSLVVVHGAPSILTMPGGEWSRQTFQASPAEQQFVQMQQANLVAVLQDLADHAPDVILAVENLVFPHEMYRSPKEMWQLVSEVNRQNLGFTLDAGHALVSGHAALDYLPVLGKWLTHVHLHDNCGVIDEHLPLGVGAFDHRGLLRALREMDYQGVVTLEFSLKDPRDFAQYLL